MEGCTLYGACFIKTISFPQRSAGPLQGGAPHGHWNNLNSTPDVTFHGRDFLCYHKASARSLVERSFVALKMVVSLIQ